MDDTKRRLAVYTRAADASPVSRTSSNVGEDRLVEFILNPCRLVRPDRVNLTGGAQIHTHAVLEEQDVGSPIKPMLQRSKRGSGCVCLGRHNQIPNPRGDGRVEEVDRKALDPWPLYRSLACHGRIPNAEARAFPVSEEAWAVEEQSRGRGAGSGSRLPLPHYRVGDIFSHVPQAEDVD